MAYTPPSGDNVDFTFQGGYSPPSGDGVDFSFETGGRSKLRQQEQIRNAATYDDAVASVNNLSVAEPTVSGSLENDTNIIRTLFKQLKGTDHWYSEPTMTLEELNDALDVGEKYVESVSTTISGNVEHILPNNLTYTPDSTSGQEGSNMDVFINGMLLAADTGSYGANEDRDYGETSTSGITFRFDVLDGFNITYVIRE